MYYYERKKFVILKVNSPGSNRDWYFNVPVTGDYLPDVIC